MNWGPFEPPAHRGHLFSEVACWPTASSPGRYPPHHFSTPLQRCFTSRYSILPRLTVSHMWTCASSHTHTHTCTIPQTLTQPPILASLAFDHLSGDVYGPLFAVLMIIVTSWFHYPYPSDGWGPPWRPLIRVSLTTGADAMNGKGWWGAEMGNNDGKFDSLLGVSSFFYSIERMHFNPLILSSCFVPSRDGRWHGAEFW